MIDKVNSNYSIAIKFSSFNFNEEYIYKVIERSKLKLNRDNIKKLIEDPNNIFKITKYTDSSLNQIQLIKLRYFIVLSWLNYLLLMENKKICKTLTKMEKI